MTSILDFGCFRRINDHVFASYDRCIAGGINADSLLDLARKEVNVLRACRSVLLVLLVLWDLRACLRAVVCDQHFGCFRRIHDLFFVSYDRCITGVINADSLLALARKEVA